MGRTRHLRFWWPQANRIGLYQAQVPTVMRVDDNALVTQNLKRAIHLKLCLLPSLQMNRSFWRALHLRFVAPNTQNMAIAHPRLTAMLLEYFAENGLVELE